MELAGRVQLLETGDLLIAAVKPNDAGKYTCVRANEAGSVNASAYLTVVGKTIFQSDGNIFDAHLKFRCVTCAAVIIVYLFTHFFVAQQ